MKRRSFVKLVIKGVGIAVGALAGLAGLVLGIDWANRRAANRPFKRTLQLHELTIGVPKLVTVFDIPPETRSFWPAEPLGQVWLIRRSEQSVQAYTARCPHLGARIDFDGESKQFVCSGHGATFDLACRRISDAVRGKKNPAPRDMDSLEVQLVPEPSAEDPFIEVHFQRFATGEKGRKPIP
jgi:Rieske Fe-S protein